MGLSLSPDVLPGVARADRCHPVNVILLVFRVIATKTGYTGMVKG